MITPAKKFWRDRIHFPASLRARAILLLAFALIPTSVVVLLASYFAYNRLAENERSELWREGEQLDARLSAAWLATARLGRQIATAIGWQSDIASACKAQLRAVLENDDRYSAIAVYRDRSSICHARMGPSVKFDEGTVPPFLDIAAGGVQHAFLRHGSTDAIIIAVKSLQNDFAPTTVTVEMNPLFIREILNRYNRSSAGVVAIVQGDGSSVVTTNSKFNIVGLREVLQAHGTQTVLMTRNGEELEIVTQKLSEFDAWLMVALPSSAVLMPARLQIAAVIGTLLFIILVTAVTVWFGLAYLILRWIHDMTVKTDAYAAGDLSARVGVALGAPQEMSVLARNFDAICDQVVHRTADLEREVAKQEHYLRDLHHHVKNTLQITSSLIGLQIRHAPYPSRAVLRSSFDRISAISGAYAAYYGQSDPSHVAIGFLITEVVNRLFQGGSELHPRPQFSFTSPAAELGLISARTLAMLLAELLPTMIDEANRQGQELSIHVATLPEQWRLEIRGPIVAEDVRGALSNRLLNAHLRHISASILRVPPDLQVIEFQREQVLRPLYLS